VKLVRDSSRLLNGAPQFVDRPEGELQWQADACRVRPGRTSGFSDCQVLWLIAGRSVSRAAVCALLPYVRDPSACQGLWKIADRSAYAKRLGERGRGVGLGL